MAGVSRDFIDRVGDYTLLAILWVSAIGCFVLFGLGGLSVFLVGCSVSFLRGAATPVSSMIESMGFKLDYDEPEQKDD